MASTIAGNKASPPRSSLTVLPPLNTGRGTSPHNRRSANRDAASASAAESGVSKAGRMRGL